MNTKKFINVYFTISQEKMYAYSKWIAKNCFKATPGSNPVYSFISNPVNGHFSYAVNSKYYEPSATPQTENEAKSLLNTLILDLNTKLLSNSESNLPKDFPSLFSKSHLKLKGISPIFNSNQSLIRSWNALYGIELQTFSQQKEEEIQNGYAALEGDSIIVEISGKRIVTLHYNHTPVIQQKAVLLFPDNNSEFIYKKVNKTTIAPYYLTSKGFIPACSESVPILTKPVNFGWSNTLQNTPAYPIKKLVTMSEIIHPSEDNPGSAKITISMYYRVITIGEGAVDNVEIIDPKEFSMLFNKGNAPGVKYKNSLKLKSLPSVDSEATTLRRIELIQSKQKDKVTGKLAFNDFYSVNIEYQFFIDKTIGLSLWEGLKWLTESSNSRGLIYLLPFPETAENWATQFYKTINVIKNELSPEERAIYTDDDLSALLSCNKGEATLRIFAEIYRYILKNIISENEEKYSNCNLYVNMDVIKFNQFVLDLEFETYLNSIGSTLYSQILDDNSKEWKNIEEFKNYYENGYDLVKHAIEKMKIFKEKEDGLPNVGAAGVIGNPNLIVLNPELYGKNSLGKPFRLGSMTATEVIAHEAGHNLAEDFFHSHTPEELSAGKNDGTYEYNQKGLQSNQHNLVFPTLDDNTIRIINDSENRKEMLIL